MRTDTGSVPTCGLMPELAGVRTDTEVCPYMRANARFGFIFSYADLTLYSNKDFSGECDCATEHNPLISSRYELARALPAMCLRRSQYRNAHKILWPAVYEGILSETISSPALKTYFFL